MEDKKRILLAEDDRFLRDLTKKLLSRSGYEVTTATNGEEAWEEARLQPADLIILDVCMPMMNGIEVAQRVRAQQGLTEVPIIFLTATDDLERPSLDKAGATQVVGKPFNNAHLLQVVREALVS